MTKFRYAHTNFKHGEISPKVQGHFDTNEYKDGVDTLENFLPLQAGGVTKRPGTKLEREIVNLGYDSALGGPAVIPFIVNNSDAYVVVIKNDGTNNGGFEIFKSDEANTQQTVTNISLLRSVANTVDPRGYVYAQSNDFLFVTHTSGQIRPFFIARDDSGNFHVDDYLSQTVYYLATRDPRPVSNPALSTPYRARNVSDVTLTPSATSGSITITASDPTFSTGHVDSVFKINHGGTEGMARVSAYSSPTSVTASVIVNFGATTASTDWAESAWSDHRGYPTSVAIYENRLCWGGQQGVKPLSDTIWFSLSGNFFHMMSERLQQDKAGSDVSQLNFFGDAADLPFASDPFNAVIGASESNVITWMHSARSLLVGTQGGEYVVDSGQNALFGNPLASGSAGFSQKKQTSFGSRGAKVAGLDNSVFYISRDGRSVRNFKYSRENGSFISAEISAHGEHMHRQGRQNFQYGYNAFKGIETYLSLIHI